MHLTHFHLFRRKVAHPILFLAHRHDDWPMFRLWFAVTTVTASIVFNLGIFTLLVSLHFVLDIIKYRSKHTLNWFWVIIESIRESIVDVFFIVLGLLLGIAFHYSVAIGGLGKLARLEILMLNLVLRVGPRLKIAEHLLEIVLYWKHHFEKPFVPHEQLSRSERSLLFATFIMGCTIFLVPFFTSMQWSEVSGTIQKELTPTLEINIMHTLESLSH